MSTEPQATKKDSSAEGGLYAWSDESGNTGNNLFDKNQPWFWTGTILSRDNLDAAGATLRKQWLAELAVSELHASDLGAQGVEKVAAALHAFVVEHDCRFVFTRVEKRTVASLKFVDTLLDSGSNMAVSPVLYANRLSRMFFANTIVKHLSPQSQEEFWAVYATGDVEGFRRFLRRLHWNIQNKYDDRRAQELLLDAIEWASQHPEKFPELRWKLGTWDSPNFIAFTLLTDGIHKECERTKLRVAKFIHDEQNQFAKVLKEAYEVARRGKFSVRPFSWLTQFEEVTPWEAEIEFVSSADNLGVELVDIVLWLMRRRVERASALSAASGKLLDWVGARGMILESSRAQLEEDVAKMVAQVADHPISPADEARGKAMVLKLEEQRKRRMLGLDGP